MEKPEGKGKADGEHLLAAEAEGGIGRARGKGQAGARGRRSGKGSEKGAGKGRQGNWEREGEGQWGQERQAKACGRSGRAWARGEEGEREGNRKR